MFNTPILDIVIGLVFVFLLYSLLITSINEAIATSLGLRSKMLKRGIVEGMLSDTPNYTRWNGLFYRCMEKLDQFILHFKKNSIKDFKGNNLGAKFYKHPLIKNYGSSEFYPHPAYIPKSNFSSVLIDILKSEFEKKSEAIALENPSIKQTELHSLHDIKKLELLFNHYKGLYAKLEQDPKSVALTSLIIQKDTLRILAMQLDCCENSLEKFSGRLEKWFDDSMYRVSGWYKRQTQYMLFALGILVAITFNVDSIEIASKLSKDKNLREQLVNSAIAFTKEHPEITKKVSDADSAKREITIAEANKKWRKVDSLLTNDVNDLNSLIALGWGDYGLKSEKNKVISDFPADYKKYIRQISKDNSSWASAHFEKAELLALSKIYENNMCLKVQYVYKQAKRPKKMLGFILTAFAISLGAPFWFDLLAKLINLRGSGKKENGSQQNSPEKPVTITVKTENNEEAVG